MSARTEGILEGELAAMEQRCEAATVGPWKGDVQEGAWAIRMGPAVASRSRYEPQHLVACDHDLALGVCEAEDAQIAEAVANMEFIAATRSDLPRLIAEVRRLQALAAPPDTSFPTPLSHQDGL